MSLWRSKRRYDTSRRLSEQADDALYALALLQSDQSDIRTRASELRDKLEAGKAVLITLRDALENPEQSDSYTYSVAQQVREHYGDIDKYAIERMNRHIRAIEAIAEDFTIDSRLTDVIEMLEVVEEVAVQTTDREAKQMRNYVANSDP